MKSIAGRHERLKCVGLFVIFATVCGTSWGQVVAGQEAGGRLGLAERMQKRVSINVRQAAIEDVIRLLADQADVDIVKSPNVTGEVTVTLTDVPLEEALNNILFVHKCAYTLDKNTIRVVTQAEQMERPVIMQSKTFEIVYADVTQVVTGLKEVKSQQGAISHIGGTSFVMVTDTEEKLKDIEEFILKVDQPTPQILVEARIYDITSKDRLDLGIEWSAGRNTTYDSTSGLSGVGTNPTAGARDPFGTASFSGASTKAETAVGVVRMGWLNNSVDIDMLLRAQQENIHAKLLANPRILVIDNETAKIKIIQEIPYQELQESSLGGSIGTTAFREVGVELEVTPHLAHRDEMIRLRLKPVFSVVTGEVDVAGVGVSYKQPVVDRREADTTLLVKNKQTVVLGGLRKKDVAHQTNKVPLLGDLPLLGGLFRFTGEDTVTSELVVFIKPVIVVEPTLTADEAEAYEETKFDGPQVIHTKAERASMKK
jgi:type IV pilus assembly protein PilQ